MYQLTLNEEILRGDIWDGIEFTINKAATDYTGATIRAHVRREVDAVVSVNKTITPSIAVNGQIKFVFALSSTESSLLNTDCVADIEVVDASQKVETSILIKFKLTKDVTK